MDAATAQALADGYVAYSISGDTSVLAMFSPDFYDNVSRSSGLAIFDIDSGWLDESLADRSADLHLVTHTDDTVMIWFTAHGRHIGNGFPPRRPTRHPEPRRLATGPHLPARG
jgi:hypothetical protein